MAFKKKEFTESEEYLARKQALENHGAAPTYDPGETGVMATEALQEYLNRPEFSYDVKADALYNQYKDQYTAQGKMAMQDTMGNAAALTGGYGNSYATTAGQQAYQGYMQQLTDKIPELQQLAYSQYMDRGEELLDKYGLLSGEEQKAYDRWRNTYSDWINERDYLANQVAQQADWDREDYWNDVNFDYGMYRDTTDDEKWQQQFDYTASRDAKDDEKWQQQFDYKDYENISSNVGDKIKYDEDGNVSDTSVAEDYLDWLVSTGMDESTAKAIAEENGLTYDTSSDNVDTAGWSNDDWMEAIIQLAQETNVETAEEAINDALRNGKIGQGLASKLLNIVRSGGI